MTSSRAIAVLLLATVASLLTACSRGASADEPLRTFTIGDRTGEIPWVTARSVHDYLEAGHEDVVFVDNRNAFAFSQKRIENAQLVPTSRIEQELPSLPLNAWLVMYCTCPDDGLAVQAAQVAHRNGYEKAVILEGGLGAWTSSGYPTASGTPN